MNPEGFSLVQFADMGEISSWALDAMTWAVYNGLINGTTPTTLAASNTATRAECATILMRYIERFME